MTLSMGTVGDCYDNALCESFFATLECELIERGAFPTRAAARLAVFDFIEAFYNRKRRHSALGYLSPVAFERAARIGRCRSVRNRPASLHSRGPRPKNNCPPKPVRSSQPVGRRERGHPLAPVHGSLLPRRSVRRCGHHPPIIPEDPPQNRTYGFRSAMPQRSPARCRPSVQGRRLLIGVTAFVDWNTQIHDAQTANLDPLPRAHKTLEKTTQAVARALARYPTTRFVVTFRLYHGWHKGWQATDNLRAIIAAAAERGAAESGNTVFTANIEYGHTLLSALPQRLVGPGIHLPDTLRQRTRSEKPQEKMVDTALASDLLYWSFSETRGWALVLSADDDLIPPVLTAEANTEGTDRQIFILKTKGYSMPRLIDLKGLLLEA